MIENFLKNSKSYLYMLSRTRRKTTSALLLSSALSRPIWTSSSATVFIFIFITDAIFTALSSYIVRYQTKLVTQTMQSSLRLILSCSAHTNASTQFPQTIASPFDTTQGEAPLGFTILFRNADGLGGSLTSWNRLPSPIPSYIIRSHAQFLWHQPLIINRQSLHAPALKATIKLPCPAEYEFPLQKPS